MKSNSPGRTFFIFAVCCALVGVEFNGPCHALAQTQVSGVDVSPLDSSKGNDDRQVGFRAATLEGKLVPLSQSKPSDRLEFQLPARSTFQSSDPANILPQRFDARFGSSGEQSQQASYRGSRRQESQTKRSGDEIESSLSLLNGGVDENENIIIQRFPDGKPRVIRHVAQDQYGNYYNDGPWEARNQAGQIVAKGSYVRGLMDGQWSRKHESNSSGLFATKPFNLFQGPFNSIAYFADGKLDGLWTIYDQYQTKIFEIPYKQGVRDGTATWFYPNQAKMREATFKQGLIDDEIVDFDEAEKITNRRKYVDGRPIVRNTTFYRPNVKKTEEYFLGKKLEPEDVDDWWEAKPTPYLATGSETQNGAAMAWYENGQPKKRGQFKDGKPVGQFTWWHANGNKQTEGFYIEGQKSRRWTWWYENGMKQVEGIFEDDQPTGVWRAWLADGELRKEKNYSEEAEPVVVESSNVAPPNNNNKAGENASVIDPSRVDPKQGVVLNGPTTEDLPAPAKAKSAEGEPEALESITPLEFRTPTTSGDPPAENKPVSEEDEIGTIPAELFEGQGDSPSADGKPEAPKTKDKST